MYEDLKRFLRKPRPYLLCNKYNKKLWAKDNIFKAVECLDCGLVWTYPIQHLYYFNMKNLYKLMKLFGLQLLAKEYPYLDTPYANVELDYAKISRDLQLILKGKRNKITQSPPFWGSMMTVIFQKQ